MNVDKAQIVDMLKQRGDDDQAAQAESELPEQVDTEKDSGMLSKLGVNPSDLMGGSGMGDKLGI